MASVEFGRLWLHLAEDHDTSLQLRLRKLDVSPAAAVELRGYAGGRLRAISTPLRRRTANVTLGPVDRADARTLEEDWPGRLLLWRDPRGRVWEGIYRSADVTEWRHRDAAIVRFTFERASDYEGV